MSDTRNPREIADRLRAEAAFWNGRGTVTSRGVAQLGMQKLLTEAAECIAELDALSKAEGR